MSVSLPLPCSVLPPTQLQIEISENTVVKIEAIQRPIIGGAWKTKTDFGELEIKIVPYWTGECMQSSRFVVHMYVHQCGVSCFSRSCPKERLWRGEGGGGNNRSWYTGKVLYLYMYFIAARVLCRIYRACLVDPDYLRGAAMVEMVSLLGYARSSSKYETNALPSV